MNTDGPRSTASASIEADEGLEAPPAESESFHDRNSGPRRAVHPLSVSVPTLLPPPLLNSSGETNALTRSRVLCRGWGPEMELRSAARKAPPSVRSNPEGALALRASAPKAR